MIATADGNEMRTDSMREDEKFVNNKICIKKKKKEGSLMNNVRTRSVYI